MPRAESARVRFLGGAALVTDVSRLELPAFPRIAFAGRSNVGKSSLLNALTGEPVARVSSEPGRTREMNFFEWRTGRAVGGRVVLVDLPGYGYAKVSEPLRKQWGREITRWLREDEALRLVVVLVDGRHGLFPLDLELIAFLGPAGIPYVVAFTKMDKWKSANQRRNAERDLAQVAARAGVEHHVCVSSMGRGGTRPLERWLKLG